MMVASTVVLTLVSVILIVESPARAKILNRALVTNEVADHYAYTSINFIFDMFLKHYTHKLIKDGKTKLHIEDFQRKFKTKFLTLDIEGAIEATDGWCSNLSTVHRTGDADMNKGPDDIILTAHLGLDDLHIDFNNYDISLLGAHQKGKIHVNIGDNSVFLKLAVQTKPVCNITVTEVLIEKLDNIQVDITDLGIFENLTDEITSLIVNEITHRYKTVIEEMVLPELAKAVKNADLCHYIPILSLQI